MLLSSVNFVAKPKSGKGCKKEEKKEEKRQEEKNDAIIANTCQECRRQALEENSIFRFPSPSGGSRDSSKTSGYGSVDSLTSYDCVGDRVTIATGDDLCLSVDQFYYTIGLKDELKSDSTCIFRKRVLESKELPNGHVDTVVFVLDCDQDFYLTTAKDKSLELNYFSTKPSVDTDDERAFLVYHTTLGQKLIQPKQHKNIYLHHIDRSLSVQQLDLNWRCPEEYFFHFNAVPEPVIRKKVSELKVCTHKQAESCTQTKTSSKKTCTRDTKKDELVMISDKYDIELPRQKTVKNKTSFSGLFLGCFSGRSQHLTQTEV